MLIGRLSKLTIMVLLVVGLGASLPTGDGQLSAPTAQASLSVSPGPSHCGHCGGCDRPCDVQANCGTPCVPSGLLATDAQMTTHHADRLVLAPSWHLSSVALRTPTPPPRSILFV
jgi:hypothetical protein